MRYTSSTLYLVLALTIISGVIVGVIAGCDEKNIKAPVIGPSAGSGPVGGGDTQKIILSASQSDTLPVVEGNQGTIQITARVENQIGQPMPDGTSVVWSTTVGTLDSPTTTTTDGASNVTLTFPQAFSGCSIVTAISGDATATISVCVTNVTPTPTPTVVPTETPTLTPTPTSTPARVFVVSAGKTVINHDRSTTITALALTDGVADANLQVNFSVSGSGTIDASAGITDSSGKATVQFTGNHSNPGSTDPSETATVTATTADGRSGSISIIVRP